MKKSYATQTFSRQQNYSQFLPSRGTELGNRSTLGVSILKQHGINDVCNVAGGLIGYSAVGYIRECRVCVKPHGSRFFTNVKEVKKHWEPE